ncbi:MAG: hypothetical protein SFV32_01445, partial [Opitutaceae bacterium]|nr:hypothetical protein [Opitutaceae bacterium]
MTVLANPPLQLDGASLKVRIIVDLCITSAVMLVALLASGAPARVHVAEGVALAIGFSLPALLICRPRDLLARRMLVFPLVLLGAFAWDVGASITISKV